MQVYTGPRRAERICNVTSRQSLQVGHLVAVNCENYADGPSIGKCVHMNDEGVQIGWMKGMYSSSLTTWIVQDEKNTRKKVPWADWIPKNLIILFDFKLMSTSRLRKTAVQHLKSNYDELRA